LDVRFDTLLGERSDFAGSAVASIVGIPEELLGARRRQTRNK
jgi:hypothetical protein